MKKKEKLLEKDLKDHELQNIEFLENKEAEENRKRRITERINYLRKEE